MPQYTCIFLDLDRTLWDFEANARDAFLDLYETYELGRIFPDFETFHQTYRRFNHRLWQDYRDGKIAKEALKYVRFQMTLEAFGKNDLQLARQLGEDYIAISATKTRLLPHSHEALSYLKERYRLFIITNGFQEVQYKKIRNSGLEEYFEGIITSEQAGVQKPHGKIFRYAVQEAEATAKESLMIGDDIEGDIKGAQALGLDQVYFNPRRKPHQAHPTYEIHSLLELKQIL